MALRLRKELMKEEYITIEQLLHGERYQQETETSPDCLAEANQGLRPPEIAERLQVSERMVRNRLHRFNEQGLQGLERSVGSGRPVTYLPEVVKRDYPDGSLQAPGSGRGVRNLDAGSAGGLPPSGQGHSHEAQSHQRDFHPGSLSWRYEKAGLASGLIPISPEKGGPSPTSTPLLRKEV